jgi:Ca-activated chloride channel homolog
LHTRRAEVAVKVAAAFAAVFLVSSIAARAQQPAPATPTFHSTAQLVALNVTVQDRSAKFVRDLQPADFVVYEDGVKQDVAFFESVRVPVDLIVMLDTSASMRLTMDQAHEAAAGFLKTLRDGDRGAVVTFANAVTVLQPLTSDQAALQKAVRSTTTGGNTCLNTAVYVALKQFGMAAAQQPGEVRRQAIVVLSDGADTASAISFDDVIDLARRMGVSIYTVMLQAPTRIPTRRTDNEDATYAMKTLARETGAQAFSPAAEGLRTVYASIAAELASQYSIGYVPVNPAPDGTFRRVNVQIVTRPQLFSRTRLGYIAAAVNRWTMGEGR